jgi:hypothetical protein
MKKYLLSFIILSFIFSACESTPKSQKAASTETTQTAARSTEGWLGSYMQLKDALVNEQQDLAVQAATEFLNQIPLIDKSAIAEANLKAFEALLPGIDYDLNQIVNLEIEEQRIVFKALSEKAVQLTRLIGSIETVYVQFCPMYAGGAAWLSLNEEIRNPFYGDKMLTCGVVQETLNP